MKSRELLLDKFIEILTKKEKLIREILQTTVRMKDAVEDVGLLSKLLDARQQYMSKIDKLDEQLSLIKGSVIGEIKIDDKKNTSGEWSEIKKIYPEQWKKIDELLVSIRNMLEQCNEVTEQCKEAADNKLKQLREKISEVRSSKKVLSAYSSKKMQVEGIFVDKKK
ncbi:MAG: hypothetical protein LRZ91_03180 [Desulfotomaculum sp.]|nr:hypothetical protein [Desulfotomaculum sp.]